MSALRELQCVLAAGVGDKTLTLHDAGLLSPFTWTLGHYNTLIITSTIEHYGITLDSYLTTPLSTDIWSVTVMLSQHYHSLCLQVSLTLLLQFDKDNTKAFSISYNNYYSWLVRSFTVHNGVWSTVDKE